MIVWEPSTCYCKIKSTRPGASGEFLRRCRIHANSRDTLDVYVHNIANQERNEPNRQLRLDKKNATRESTRP